MLELLKSYWETLPKDLAAQKAWDRFLAIGLPTRKTSAFQYLSLQKLGVLPPASRKKLERSDILPHILPECSKGFLVFVDGFFEESLSCIPAPLSVLSSDAALLTYGLFLQNRLARSLKEEQDPFAALNSVFQGRGAFLYAPPNCQMTSPIQVLHVFTLKEMATPRLQLYLGKRANLHLIQTALYKEETHFVNGAIDCALDEGARLVVETVEEMPRETQNFQHFYASLKRDSHLKMLYFTKGSSLNRLAVKAQLCEENAEVDLRGLWSLSQDLEAHVHATVEHLAPHTRSRQHFKGVLRDRSRSSFEGKILVRPIAQKTEAYQLNNNLLLSDESAAHVKPNLEVFADDVKASHGATITQLNKEDLFYLTSRGLNSELARTWLINGFCREFLEQLSLPNMSKYVQV
ncbi:MAG: Fe-S cluster assembly protein SufD [Chlamydiota bacterium]